MPEIGKPFNDLNSYNELMSKSLEDKLFFIDRLPKEEFVFIDFGCADGTLLRALDPSNIRIGYDISKTMLEIAKSKSENIIYTNKWTEIKDLLRINNTKKSVLILSSVIHEVYSYIDSLIEIMIFWDRVLYTGFDYIVIRDMIPSKDIYRPSNFDDVCNIFKFANPKQLYEFEYKFGPITVNKNLVHFLLKYRYTANWEREVCENYFPLYVEDLLKYFDDFNIIYQESFKILFLEDCIKNDFKIELKDNTHLKIIFKKR